MNILKSNCSTFIVLVILGALSMSSCTESSDRQPKVVRITVNGVPMMVPWNAIPPIEKGLYRSGKSEALGLEVNWPSLSGFTDVGEDIPAHIRYRDQISILLDPLNNDTDEKRLYVLSAKSKRLLDTLEPSAPQFEMLKFIYADQEKARKAPWPLDDYENLYIYPSLNKVETIISGSADFEPEPDTAEAAQRNKDGIFVKIPYCDHYFFVPGLLSVSVQLHYRRIYLHEWKKIQKDVGDLLLSFVAKAKSPESN